MPLGLVAKGLMAGSLVEIKRRAWARAATAIRDGTTSRTQAVDLRGSIRQVVGGEADCGHSAALAAQQKPLLVIAGSGCVYPCVAIA